MKKKDITFYYFILIIVIIGVLFSGCYNHNEIKELNSTKNISLDLNEINQTINCADYDVSNCPIDKGCMVVCTPGFCLGDTCTDDCNYVCINN